MSQELFDRLATASQVNFENSLAVALGNALMNAGYVLYWHRTDGLQTPDGWYAGYRANGPTYTQDATLAARLATATGLFTMLDRPSALPRFATRPTTEGLVGAQTQVQLPAGAVDVGEIITGDAYEIGTRLRWRTRVVTMEFQCRDQTEQSALADLLTQTFDEQSSLVVQDHAGGSLATVGTADVVRVSVTSDFNPAGPEAETYELTLRAQLEFVA